MNLSQLFQSHISVMQSRYEETLALLQKEDIHIEAVLVHSGTESVYFADDNHVLFQAHAHFQHWLPVQRPDQMVLFQPNKRPVYFQVVPTDFWYEQTVNVEDWWANSFDIVKLSDSNEVMDHLPKLRRIAFLGQNTAFASSLGIPSQLQNERHLCNRLDYCRSIKTDYEVSMVEQANQKAMLGHQAAFDAFMGGGSEWGIHMSFLTASEIIESESPYTNIVGLDEKSAILHYQNKRRQSGMKSRVLLIDAGCKVNGYCSDITRTYTRGDAHPVFTALVAGVDQLQQDLVEQVVSGLSYTELHNQAHEGVLDLLLEHDLCRGSREELKEKNATAVFYPHGTGHLLGLQVHDVSGHFKDNTGVLAPPPEEHRFLRLTRKMEPGMVFTIEPGLYFIPVLLDPHREDELGKLMNWTLIDELTRLGGIRVEDNIVVTQDGRRNLTR